MHSYSVLQFNLTTFQSYVRCLTLQTNI